MNRRLFVGLATIVLFLVTLSQPAPAQALSYASGYENPSCTNVVINITYSVNRDNTGTGAEHYAHLVTDGAGNVLARQEYTDNFSGTDNFMMTYTAAPQYNPIRAQLISFAGNGLPEQIAYENSFNCPGLPFASGAFFNPGDGRIDPRPGDRLAVYCNPGANPPNVDVWGVLNDSSGRRLYTFPFSDLVKAGAKGITKKVEPLGTIFLSVDANNNFFAVWTGGPAAATGTRDFTKAFTCGFTR
jgi:hypothetical protein